MKIAYFCDEYPPAPHGGIGTFVQTIAHAMVAAGHEVTVVGFDRRFMERYDAGVRLIHLPSARIPRVTWLLNRLALRRWLAVEVASGRIDLIELPEFSGPLPLPFKACPVVVRLHLSATAIARAAGRRCNPAVSFCERATLQLHHNWIAVSRHILALTKQTFRLGPSVCSTIYYPVALPSRLGSVQMTLPERFVLYAGTVSQRKGAYLLAQSARNFLMAEPSTHLIYAGPLASDLGVNPQARILEIIGPELAHRVHFTGRLDRCSLAAVMQRATVFAFPSSLEAFGLTVAEAMLAGVPVVVPDTPPFDEFVTDGQTGFLVPAGDPEALGSRILRLLREPGLARFIGDSGRSEIASQFSVERCVLATKAFYEQCVTGQAAQRGPLSAGL